MSYCKYCESPIQWIEKKPHNSDGTGHDYEFCQALKKQRKLAHKQWVAERFRPAVLRLIKANNELVVSRNFKRPENPYAKSTSPIVVELLEGTSKVDWAATYVGILSSGAKCLVHYSMASGNCNEGYAVHPFNKSKKNTEAYMKAFLEINQ
jgi:hypothetical protein